MYFGYATATFFGAHRKEHVKAMMLENIKQVRLPSKNDFRAKRKASSIEKDFFNYAESEAESLENCTSECDAEAELSQYLASAQGCDDVLKFWVHHKDKYPRLFQLSRQILCAPASTAGVERLFSVAGFLLDNRALNINDDYFEARLFTKANRDLIPVVKKWFKPDYVTGNE